MTQAIDYTPFFFEHEGMEIRRVDLEAGMRFKVDPTYEYGFELKQLMPVVRNRVFYAERQLPEGQGSLVLINFDLVRQADTGDHTHRVMLGPAARIIRRNADGQPIANCRIEEIPIDPDDARLGGAELSCLEAESLISFRWGGNRGSSPHAAAPYREALSRFLREGLVEPTNEACFDYRLTDKGERVVFAMLRTGSEALQG